MTPVAEPTGSHVCAEGCADCGIGSVRPKAKQRFPREHTDGCAGRNRPSLKYDSCGAGAEGTHGTLQLLCSAYCSVLCFAVGVCLASLARIRARLTNWNGSTIDAGRTYVTAAAHNGTFAAVRWGRSYQTASGRHSRTVARLGAVACAAPARQWRQAPLAS